MCPTWPTESILNGLKEAAARDQQPALLLRLQELKQTLVKEDKEASESVAALKKATEEKAKLEYRVTHLCRTIDEMEKTGGGSKAAADWPTAVQLLAPWHGTPPRVHSRTHQVLAVGNTLPRRHTQNTWGHDRLTGTERVGLPQKNKKSPKTPKQETI